MQHLPQQEPMPPVVRVIDGQNPAQKVMDKGPELLSRILGFDLRRVPRLTSAPMCVQNGSDVQLLLIPKVIIHRRDIRPGAFADCSDPCRFESLLRKLFARRLKQPNPRGILDFHWFSRSKHLFQTDVSINFTQLRPSVKPKFRILSYYGLYSVWAMISDCDRTPYRAL